ncbi:helix-turn-helix domain-containing protein [Streptoalloteichus hindustanus]|uniref:Helix-turn-helix domain-containing protein n=1 Tax=Streptoalloteichus hindustanus TaxID=2017 RepID=A0A1M5JRY9_STRHI|nr:helix-turn-helix transcriptional regulator [Streptoalloteichus hindustanus]SHG43327.1 Helix-turn-helix domain-containing protein [Streptoalloteichus hindustanus]
MAETPPEAVPLLSPTVGRRWLAQEFRRLREAANMTQSDVAKRLRCASTKITHLESMRNTFNATDLEIALPFLGVPPERVEWYLRIWEASREKGWWDGSQAIPSWFSFYVGLEWGASEIHSWDMGYIPGLLQTQGYAEAVITDGATVNDSAINEQVVTRLRRQEALRRRENPLRLHAILDESVLRRRVGSPQVMRDQLRHLATLDEGPTITLQVMPFARGEHRGQLGSFKWLGFPQEGDPGVVYLENQGGGLYLEKSEQLSRFRADFVELSRRALAPEASIKLINSLLEELG